MYAPWEQAFVYNFSRMAHAVTNYVLTMVYCYRVMIMATTSSQLSLVITLPTTLGFLTFELVQQITDCRKL